ncbi:hypothetical protein FOA52_005002 [Chlamydomonas sp. UWO 241]|nr:hypothetical protein FOA52_005002 [Chlamydomonas sp. UWO 241]
MAPPDVEPSLASQKLSRLISSCKMTGAVFAVAGEHRDAADDVHVSSMLLRVGKLRGDGTPAGTPMDAATRAGVALLLRLALARLEQMPGAHIANTLWAVAKLGINEPARMGVPAWVDAFVSRAWLELPRFNPKNVAHTAWALASLDYHGPAFMHALLQTATPQLSNFNAQNLSNTTWALATLGHSDAAFMGALLVVGKHKLPSFDPQSLANTAWGMAILDCNDSAFMGALLAAATPRLRTFAPQDLANIAWALGILDYVDPAFMRALMETASAKLPRFSNTEVNQLHAALSMLDINHEVARAVAELHIARAAAPKRIVNTKPIAMRAPS